MAKNAPFVAGCGSEPKGEKHTCKGPDLAPACARVSRHVFARRSSNVPRIAPGPALRNTPSALKLAIISADEATRSDLLCIGWEQGWTLEPFPTLAVLESAVQPTGHQSSSPCLFDAAILDVCKSGTHTPCGAVCTQRLRSFLRDLGVLVLVPSRCCANCAFHCLIAGARGYLTKPATRQTLLSAITGLAHEGAYICKQGQKPLADSLEHIGARCTLAGLSQREFEVMACVAQGLSDKEIGRTVGISEETVHFHLSRVYEKWGVHTRAAARCKFLDIGQSERKQYRDRAPRGA